MREVGLRVGAVKLSCAQQTVERGGAFAAIVCLLSTTAARDLGANTDEVNLKGKKPVTEPSLSRSAREPN